MFVSIWYKRFLLCTHQVKGTKMTHTGNYGVYTPDPGTVETAGCGICGEVMGVTRNVLGPRGYLMAVSRSTSWHDFFICPYYRDDWHRQVSDLIRESSHTASLLVQELIGQEIAVILQTHECTLPDRYL